MSCGISGLPIEVGDPVKILLLTETSDSRIGGFGPNGYWTPRTPPISGVYDDYGHASYYKEKEIQELWLKVFEKDIVEMQTGDNEYHDVAVHKHMTFDELMNAIIERRVKITDTYTRPKTHEVSMSMVRQDVWDILLEMTFETTYDGELKPVQSYVKSMHIFHDSILKMKNVEYSALLGGGYGPLSLILSLSPASSIREHYNIALDTNTVTDELLQNIAETAKVASILHYIHKKWMPSHYSGQSSYWKINSKYHKAIAKISDKKKKTHED